jgi:Methyltransferase domain
MSNLDYILNKYQIKLGREYFIDIPQMVGSVDLAKLFAELGFKKGVEIGTDRGEFAEVLCKTIPNLYLNCIDPWKAEAYTPGEQPESGENQDFFDDRYHETSQRLLPYNANIIRLTSMQALNNFEDNSLDFVYIDGNHDFLNVTQDIHYWYRKVHPGGIISGHDYVNYPFRKYNHVKKVVQAYARAYQLLPVFAVMQDKHGLKRDRYRSWFIVKV